MCIRVRNSIPNLQVLEVHFSMDKLVPAEWFFGNFFVFPLAAGLNVICKVKICCCRCFWISAFSISQVLCFSSLFCFPRHPNKLIILWGKENNSCQTKVCTYFTPRIFLYYSFFLKFLEFNSLNFIRLLRVVITLSVTTLLRGENDSKQSDEFQAMNSTVYNENKLKLIKV